MRVAEALNVGFNSFSSLEPFLIPISCFPAATNQLSILFLDFGQGDCEILVSGNHTILIDTATEEMASRIISFLNSKQV